MYNLFGGICGEHAIHTILLVHLQNCMCAAKIKSSQVQGRRPGSLWARGGQVLSMVGGVQFLLARGTRPRQQDNDLGSLGRSTQTGRAECITSPWSCLNDVEASTVPTAPPLSPPPSLTTSRTFTFKGSARGPCLKSIPACTSCMGSSIWLRVELSPGHCRPINI